MVDLDSIEHADEAAELLDLIEEHHQWTGSTIAQGLIDNWEASLSRFVKVMPRDYKRVLLERQNHDPEIESTLHDEKTTQQGAA